MVLEPLIEKCVEEIERDILALFLAKDKFELVGSTDSVGNR